MDPHHCCILFSLWIVGVFVVYLPSATALASSKKATTAATTIAVCTGIDCRSDGSTDCLRKVQAAVRELKNDNEENDGTKMKKQIIVSSRACLGPCGDGPNIMIIDNATNKRIPEDQPTKINTSLVPPNMFGTNPRGIYQVRTRGQLNQVLRIAQRKQPESRGADEEDPTLIVTSTRAAYDRPYNERKVLQRLMQFMVVVGLYSYSQNHGGRIGTEQWQAAAALAAVSSFIMKDNLVTQIFR